MNPVIRTEILSRVAAILVAYPELAEDPALLVDTLEGETAVMDLIDAALASIREAEQYRDACKVVAKTYTKKADRHEGRKVALRNMLMGILDACGLRSLQRPGGTLSVVAGRPSLVLTDADAVPGDYRRTETVVTLDRPALMEALKEGRTIPGAALSNGAPHLQVR